LQKYLFTILFVSGFLFGNNLYSQKDTVINGIHFKMAKKTKVEYGWNHKRLIPLDSEFVLNNKKFRYFNNWLTVGAGVQQNTTYQRKAGFTMGGDFMFHIKRRYFQVGTELSGPKFQSYQNYQFHGGIGYRFEDNDVHVSAFIGPTYSIGYQEEQIDTVITNRGYNEVGAYFQVEIIKKIAPDVGLGASLYADWNHEQTLFGLRAILYFSGSYKGKKINYPED
jgi:hypothetical protein